jgi:glucokinase
VKVLAGDIGGTKTSLAVFEAGDGQLEVLSKEKYPSREYASLDQIVRHFLDKHNPDCDFASFGIAGPVRNGKSETTNLPWRVDAHRMAVSLDFRQVWLMNDLEANAWGINALEQEDFHVLQQGDRDAGGNTSIISAGTGLGQAGMYWDGSRHRPFGSEGGHSDFAPNSDLEVELLRYLRQRYEHVSWERVVSGMGLVNIHAFLREFRKSATPQWLIEEMQDGDAAAAISRAAQASKCPVCSEALELFVHLYGVEAGNHALKIMATGGVYIGGGIAPKILDNLEGPTFLHGFRAKGRMEALMRDMPVKIILNDRTALYGPALFAAEEVVNR